MDFGVATFEYFLKISKLKMAKPIWPSKIRNQRPQKPLSTNFLSNQVNFLNVVSAIVYPPFSFSKLGLQIRIQRPKKNPWILILAKIVRANYKRIDEHSIASVRACSTKKMCAIWHQCRLLILNSVNCKNSGTKRWLNKKKDLSQIRRPLENASSPLNCYSTLHSHQSSNLSRNIFHDQPLMKNVSHRRI